MTITLKHELPDPDGINPPLVTTRPYKVVNTHPGFYVVNDENGTPRNVAYEDVDTTVTIHPG